MQLFLYFFEDITLLLSNVPLDDCKYYGLFLRQRIIVWGCYTSSSVLC